ncbi:uroporphyrinogen-III synthase [Carboxydothermus hydrogenoformans]|uniref:Uroporphyrinogen-III synthase n=1 Tax=Carboxydothermus hydrogenoformans (strain ATCC BAA-161 / DSM 6008 / Z-2901) TaxID=246194 RepID=Q3ACT2_CARHZ|nr:uroporphyrinogen-III synthase [Carboxydothermus hydrogenoformans]ABB14245.1 uroporphyrinogen-III synthase [Carboxydothermus hydrogenoformans Z-2901]
MSNSLTCRVLVGEKVDYFLNSELFFRGLRDAKNIYFFDEELDFILKNFVNTHLVSELPSNVTGEDVILITKKEDLLKTFPLKNYCFYNLQHFLNNGPLAGVRVLIPRTEADEKRECGRFGAIGIEVPLLKITYIPDERILQLDFSAYDWLIFTSAHGVEGFFFNLNYFNVSLENFIGKIAVVGEKTAKALKKYGLTADFSPQKFTAKDLALELTTSGMIQKGVIVIQGNLGRPELLEILARNNIPTKKLVVYENAPNVDIKPFLNGLLKAKLIDVLFFTSPSTFNNFYQFISDENLAKNLPHFAIGPTTYEAFLQKDIRRKYFSSEHTLEGLWQTLKNHWQGE